jgi:hypothetical protein
MSVEVHYKHPCSPHPIESDASLSHATVDPANLPAELRTEALFLLYTPNRSLVQLAREIPPGQLIREVAEAEDVVISEMLADQRMPDEDRPRKPHPADSESVALARAAAGAMQIIYAIAYDKPDNLLHGVNHMLSAHDTLALETQVYNAHRLSEVAALLGDHALYEESFLFLQDVGAMDTDDLQALIWSRWKEYEDIRDRWQTKGPEMMPDPPEELTHYEFYEYEGTTYRWQNTKDGRRYEDGPWLAEVGEYPRRSLEHTRQVAAVWRLESLRDAAEALDLPVRLSDHVHNKALTGERDGSTGTYRPPHEHMYDQPNRQVVKTERYVAATVFSGMVLPQGKHDQ